jgi:hypothetical protein
LILPLAFINGGISSYPATLLQQKSVWSTDVQWSASVGGQLFITDTGGLPPLGYNAGGQFRNALTSLYTFTPQYAAGGILTAGEAVTGSLGEFDWESDYKVTGVAQDISWTPKDGTLGSSLNQVGLGGFSVDDWTTLEFTGTLISDIRIERRLFSFNIPDTDVDEDNIDPQSLEFMSYLSGVPSSVTLEPAGGGAGIIYDFYRFWRFTSIEGSPEAPSVMLQGLSLGYRRRRA